MAKIKLPKWLSEVYGKCNRGETVFRRFRKTIVLEANPSPSYTRTEKQDKVRKAYAQALREWYKLSPEEREEWREKGRPLGLPAYQTFMKYRIKELLASIWIYELTIDNSSNSNTLNDYQVLLRVNNDSDFFSTVQDRKFMEFYDSDKETLLNHYVELWDDVNYNARIWIKIPEIPANGVKKIYLKRNTLRTEDLSNGDKVFDFFDGFEGTTKMVYGCTSCLTLNPDGTATLDGGSAHHDVWANYQINGNVVAEMKAKINFDNPTTSLIGISLVKESENKGYEALLDERDTVEDLQLRVDASANQIFAKGSKIGALDISKWYLLKLIYITDGTFSFKVYEYDNYALFDEAEGTETTYSTPFNIGMHIYNKALVDFIRIRKYTSPMPTVSYSKIS